MPPLVLICTGSDECAKRAGHRALNCVHFGRHRVRTEEEEECGSFYCDEIGMVVHCEVRGKGEVKYVRGEEGEAVPVDTPYVLWCSNCAQNLTREATEHLTGRYLCCNHPRLSVEKVQAGEGGDKRR